MARVSGEMFRGSVLDGEHDTAESILLFKPAAGTHGMQFFSAGKFVLFLRPSGDAQRAQLNKLPPAEYPVIRKKFSELRPSDTVWTLASQVDQWMAYFPIEEKSGSANFSILRKQLSAVGVGSTHGPIDYLTRLIKLRRLPQAAKDVLPGDRDAFVRQVLQEPSGPFSKD